MESSDEEFSDVDDFMNEEAEAMSNFKSSA
jgi:hypothetical protein